MWECKPKQQTSIHHFRDHTEVCSHTSKHPCTPPTHRQNDKKATPTTQPLLISPSPTPPPPRTHALITPARRPILISPHKAYLPGSSLARRRRQPRTWFSLASSNSTTPGHTPERDGRVASEARDEDVYTSECLCMYVSYTAYRFPCTRSSLSGRARVYVSRFARPRPAPSPRSSIYSRFQE